MTVGVAKTDKIFYSAATGIGNPIVYVGSKTGRDGIHGATMASADFDENSDEKRPTVQVGDPFTEKLLIEACLELMATDAIVAIQDMGAAGLTSLVGRDGEQGRRRHPPRHEQGAVPRRRHDALRDDALREPGAHADGAEARPRGRGRGDLPQVGARLRGHRRGHRHRPHGAGVRTARSSATSRSARWPTKRRCYDRPLHQPGRVQGLGAGEAARRRARKAPTSPRTCSS